MMAVGMDISQEIVLRKEKQGLLIEWFFKLGRDAKIQEWQIFLGNSWSKRQSKHPRRPPISQDTDSQTLPRRRRILVVGQWQKPRLRGQSPPQGPKGQRKAEGIISNFPAGRNLQLVLSSSLSPFLKSLRDNPLGQKASPPSRYSFPDSQHPRSPTTATKAKQLQSKYSSAPKCHFTSTIMLLCIPPLRQQRN